MVSRWAAWLAGRKVGERVEWTVVSLDVLMVVTLALRLAAGMVANWVATKVWQMADLRVGQRVDWLARSWVV